MSTEAVRRIAMWSGPRNISTAMMRSFGSRSDCAVTDEPFYGAFLRETGIRQPMADDVMASMDCDWQSIATAMRGPVPGGKALWYQKHMPHHMVGPIAIEDLVDHTHVFLIRAPEAVVASYAAKRVEVTPDDLGYERQWAYIQHVAKTSSQAPVIMDSAAILAAPEKQLRALCDAIAIPWDPAMLQWQKGGRSTDGVWASHWYNRVIETTTFAAPSARVPVLNAQGREVADLCRPFYETMAAMAIETP